MSPQADTGWEAIAGLVHPEAQPSTAKAIATSANPREAVPREIDE